MAKNNKADMSCARVKKYTASDVSKAERHNERKNETYENMNVIEERIPFNVHFKKPFAPTYMEQLKQMETNGLVSLRGLRKDATLFNEIVIDVNTMYFERNGGYEYAKQFYEEAYHFIEEKFGADNVISAVMHADEINVAATEELGKEVYHYHLHAIVKRKKKYSVVYTYTDENGNKRQKWETFETNSEAKKRKLQVEYEQESGTFIPPSAKTVNDLLDEYMSIYGVNTWAMSTYESRKSLIANYIRPLIGDMKLEDVTPRIMDKYYRDLLSVKAVSSKYVKARTEYLTPHTVREVHKTLRNAFNQAVKWELMTRNPVEHATLPKEEHKTRDIWTAEVLQKALEACDDDILRLAINLAFSCSLRMGELLGLTWDCICLTIAMN